MLVSSIIFAFKFIYVITYIPFILGANKNDGFLSMLKFQNSFYIVFFLFHLLLLYFLLRNKSHLVSV